MTAVLFYYMTLISGSLLGAVKAGKRFEETVTVNLTAVMLVLFLCGISGFLNFGVTLVMAVSAFAFGYAVFTLVRQKRYDRLRDYFLTPGFAGFTLLFLFCLWTDWERVCIQSDEYSHWALCVKEMLRLNAMSTAPGSVDHYANYPPAMGLVQYYVQRMLVIFEKAGTMQEGLLYFCYNTVMVCFLMPVLKDSRWKRPGLSLAAFVTVVLTLRCVPEFPLGETLLIDGFLSVVFAAGFSQLLLSREIGIMECLNVCACLAFLVLSKDAGIGFAAILLLAFTFMCFGGGRSRKDGLMRLVPALAACFVPLILWKLHVALSGSNVMHGQTGSISELLGLFIGRDPSGYRYQIADFFVRSLFRHTYLYPLFGKKLPLIYILVLTYGALIAYRIFFRKDFGKAAGRLFLPILFLHGVVYCVGLMYVYMFHMDYAEAVSLAEFVRYLSILIFSLCLTLVYTEVPLFLKMDSTSRGKHIAAVLLILAVTLLQLPGQSPYSREASLRTHTHNERYNTAVALIQDNFDEEDCSVLIIEQEASYAGWDGSNRIMPYLLRPHNAAGIALGVPSWEGDWERDVSPEDLLTMLKEEYCFVFLLKTNDYLKEHYAQCFVPGCDAVQGGLYRVDKETGMLSFVGRTE